ncbi:serine protease [Streptomyces sp. ITFR-16]|nr:serine protease [Streptomyces sp. ITFR-16]WNI26853.1 serine protease [Streptomyces sp. ITFR-16]
MLLTQDRVLTCAHVVDEVAATAEPDTRMWVEFAENPGIPPVAARVAPGGWLPALEGRDREDIAVLALESPRPQAEPAPLGRGLERGREVWIGGYSQAFDDGMWLTGRISGLHGAWVQLDAGSNAEVVRPGFSGAAVQTRDEARRVEHVVGLVVSWRGDLELELPTDNDLAFSYMIPVDRIAELVPLVAELSGPDGWDSGLSERLRTWFAGEGRPAVRFAVVRHGGGRDRTLRSLEKLYEPAEYGRPWRPEAEGMDKDLWVPLKVDLKSIVWYREGEKPQPYPAPLSSWCMAMGDDGASGWPGSDWIEDLILQQAGQGLYERWATGDLEWTAPQIVHAWSTWAALLAQGTRKRRDALLDDDHRGPAGGHGLLFGGGCALEHQGSFARSFYGDRGKDAAFTDSARLLPGGAYTVKAHEVSADFAALFGDGRQARDLIRRLASEEAQADWGRRGGVFSVNSAVPAEGGPVEKEIGDRLTGRRVPLCLDASDVMPAAVRDAFYEAVLLTVAHPDAPVRERLEDIQKVQDAQPPTLPRLTGVCGRPQ